MHGDLAGLLSVHGTWMNPASRKYT